MPKEFDFGPDSGLTKTQWDELWGLYCQGTLDRTRETREDELEALCKDANTWYEMWVRARPIRNGSVGLE